MYALLPLLTSCPNTTSATIISNLNPERNRIGSLGYIVKPGKNKKKYAAR
jgi:hypothetical protein